MTYFMNDISMSLNLICIKIMEGGNLEFKVGKNKIDKKI